MSTPVRRRSEGPARRHRQRGRGFAIGPVYRTDRSGNCTGCVDGLRIQARPGSTGRSPTADRVHGSRDISLVTKVELNFGNCGVTGANFTTTGVCCQHQAAQFPRVALFGRRRLAADAAQILLPARNHVVPHAGPLSDKHETKIAFRPSYAGTLRAWFRHNCHLIVPEGM